MARITVEDCLDKVHNRFALVLLVAKRAKQLMKGDECITPGRNNKHVVNALREVASGAVYFDTTDPQGLTPDQQVQRDLSR
ncbi:MAG TPA: DNA-directed RNA polymerase subunit omega [Bdellovibrionales bacterium]|nr:DNA-directed RNA polymerase subunit omega [Bdellovibrionales bacterium]